MFRILPRTPLSSRHLSAAALVVFLLPAAVQALPATVPAPAAPAPAAGPLETAWAWLVSLLATDGTAVTRQPTPGDELDGATYNLMPTLFEGSHLDPNGGF